MAYPSDSSDDEPSKTGDHRPEQAPPWPKNNSTAWRLLAIPGLIVAGLAIGFWQPWSIEELLEAGRQLGENPLFLVGIVLGMAILFTFGLPASLCLWLIAPFQPPWIAVPLLLAGSLLGAAGAYFLGSKIRTGWQPGQFGKRVVTLLDQRGDFLTQIALRVLPGFPHSVINFAGGILRLNLVTFLFAALFGLAVKLGVYATAVHGATEAVETGEAISPTVIVPLILLAVLLLLGSLARFRVKRQTKES